MKSKLIILFLLIVLAVAFFTNPDEQVHQAALKAKSTEIMDEIIAERTDVIGSVAWQFAGEQLFNGFINSHVSVDNYYLFSVPKLNWDGKSYPIGVGVFGKVFITKQLNRDVVQPILDDLEQDIKQSLPDFLNLN